METLQMFDASGGMDWAESLQNALGKDGEVAEDADAVPPIAVPAASALEPGESEIPASQTSQPEDAKLEEIEIPPTQPSPHPTLPDPESPAPEVPLEKYLNGPYETSPEKPQGGENTRKDEEEEKPLAKGLPEESPEFPMVSRESQHAFKNSKGYVAKMDAANRGDGPPMKRPAAKSGAKAKAKAKAKRTKQDSLAQPVPPAREAGTEEIKPKNLNPDFEEAASDIIEVEDVEVKDVEVKVTKRKRKTGTQIKEAKDDNDEEKEPPNKTRRSTLSTGSTASAGPAAKAKARAKAKAKGKASPKKKVAKTVETPKGKKKDKKEKTEPENPDLPDDNPSEKRTFAGRRCPTSDVYAQRRFVALKTVFNRHIHDRIKSQPSNVEAWFFFPKKNVLNSKGILNPISFTLSFTCPVQIFWWNYAFKNIKPDKTTEQGYINKCVSLAALFLESKEVSTLSQL